MRVLCLIVLFAAVVASPAVGLDSIDALVPAPESISVVTGYAPKDGPTDVTIDETRADLGEEGYELVCDRQGYRLTAATDKGLHYGKLTLSEMKRLGSIPCCTVVDRPKMKMRAVMLDLARCKENYDYYHRVIHLLGRWKINTVFLHLTDNQGCALEIKKYPKLATKYAFTQDEMKDLIEYADACRIELIPEIESWGHAGCITRLVEFAELAESPEHRRTLCTSKAKTWEMLGDIYSEVAALFPSKYIHVGCDEAVYGNCELCKAKSADALVAEHLTKVAELAKSKGKIPMMWADVLVGESNRPAADAIPKDIVMCYWNYDAEVDAEPARFLKSKGFAVLGCPALVSGGQMILPSPDAFDNMASFAKVVLDEGCTGMETTVWLPQRYIPDTLCFGLAYASELSWSGEKRTRLDFAKAFTRSHFGFASTTEFARTLWQVHGVSEQPNSISSAMWNSKEVLSKLGVRETIQDWMPRRERAKAIGKTLARYRANVKEHLADYDALVLAANTAAHVGARAVGGCMLEYHVSSARTATRGGVPDEAVKHLQDAAEMLEGFVSDKAAIAGRLESYWNRWRYADDPIKTTRGHNLMGYFLGADAYMNLIVQRLETAATQVANDEKVDWDGMFAEADGQ